ncbi:hypothetical protein B0T16DRAFT_394343 [Cercophora newfieldiana]|uniref:Uncharacterized protein n=1 Tax=Cercophora newfieldiana TaxID=92897 RepID=A0AA39XXQ1_9PEZI|nr:hypothetical protein B0T16DRAFT_394343 [Cercophora newfieldiana]
MVNPSAWEPPHLPPLEPDEFVPADGQAPSSFNSPPHYRVPTLTPPFPEYPGFPPASAHGNGDFTAGAVFDFIDTSAGGFEDSLWTDDINFDGAGLESLDLRSASTPLDLEFSHHHHQHDLNPALGTIPFHPAPRGSHGTHHSAADLLLEFERRVSALLDPLPGMTAPEGDLEIECLDTEQEHILMRISRERGRAIRFEPSRYPKRSRVAIIPGYTPYSGPGPPISSSFQASGPPTWPASHTSPHPSSGTTRSGALSAPPRPKELGVAGPSTPQIANPNRNPPPPSGTTSTHKPKASGKDPVARPPSSAASTRPSVRRSPSTETIAPKASHSRSIKQRLLRASKSSRESRDADKTREACWACRVMRKKGPEGAALEKVHRAFDLAKERRHHDVYEAKAFGRTTSDDDPYRRILLKVATTDIKDLRGFVYNLGNDRFAYDFPYDALILKIVWELVDNRAAAKIIGIEDAEDLVAMLESASRCEAKFRKWETKRRLVYSAMNCLKDCLEAIRLCTSEPSLLTTAAHAHCTSAECTSPGLDGLSKRLPKYADFLTSALLRKKRDEDDDWLVVFYSLCIQGYIRRGLVELERAQKQR